MLSESNNKIFFKLIQESSKEEIIWMCGYMYGLLFYNKDSKIFQKKEEEKITLVYGTETGNAKNLAFDFYQKAKNEKLKIKLISLDQYCLKDLEKEDYFFIIMSTHGEGEPPFSAKSFFNFIHHNKNIFLKNMKYSVLALGDRSYTYFCKAGEDVDKRLYDIGAIRIVPLQKCDIDYEIQAERWFSEILNFIKKKKCEINTENRNKKIYGKILNKIILNNQEKGSNKEIHHIEIFVKKNKIKYLPGDSIGIYPENPYNEVNNIIEYIKNNRKKEYEKYEEKNKIFDLFQKNLNILYLSDNFLKKYSFLSEKKNIPLNQKWKLTDLLIKFPMKNKCSLKELIKIMDPIKPRLYSISSSPTAHVNEIHITVSRHRFQLYGETLYGHCSDFLSKLKIGDELSFFIYKNQSFKLPNLDKDIILIGPGTGIAPFRSFLYEREATEATGKNWLFFGDQHFYADFLYQKEIKNWKMKGILHRVSFSFSRDQEKKIYVQNKIWENRIEFFSWIKNGAHVYICGNKIPMSLDVEKMICHVIEKVGKCDSKLFIKKMKKEGRYLKDVY
ncbi:sulfite reductase flavoprotein subunit alpha [Blattabacterium sp. (Blaberus giganteus)]|uniref:diflavin oxidoreductase n=1 Tax=Blattabacterium sp. (Blaberus giganteus) TaxID=1186051 RepID=UPI00025F6F63|nr:flavodoxin domain-containing protein [Blattabacterium sp. (Blaberus giganteus)]AFJ90790.1 sulfite reductase [NADPH] flavoprotein alpha-component (SIR-FP) [Blattabacterium sp. (Blaberus giganteus)]